MKLFSNSLDNNGVLKNSCSLGSNVSLHLKWDKVTKANAYAISLIDYDAAGVVGVPFVHWVAIVLDAHLTELQEGDSLTLPANILFQFENNTTKKIKNTVIPSAFQSNQAQGFFGPFPPDKDHFYQIEIYALKNKPNIAIKDFYAYPYFQELVHKNQILGMGKLTFIGKQAIYNNENAQFSLAEKNTNLTNVINNEVKEITNLQINGMTNVENTNILKLDDLIKNSFTQKIDLPEITFDNIQDVKSYVAIVINSNYMNKLGVNLINWVAYGIKPNSQDKMVINQATNIKKGINSFSSVILPSGMRSLLSVVEKNENEEIGLILQKTKNFSNNFFIYLNEKYFDYEGFHTLKIFATNLPSYKLNENLNLQEVMQAIQNHILAIGTLNFKIKK